MKISFVFDTEKDNPQNLIDMLSNFIEDSADSDVVVKELRNASTITTKRDKRYKLSFDEVCDIRKACEEGVPTKELARKYGVTESNISLIKLNKTRLHY